MNKTNYKCKKCGHVCGTKGGMAYHMNAHHDTSKVAANIKTTNEKPTREYSKKSRPKLITPQMNYVDVEVILRIPLYLGQAKILEAAENENQS